MKEHYPETSIVGADQIISENELRTSLDNQISQLERRNYGGILGQKSVEYMQMIAAQDRDSVPYSIPGQLILTLETNE